MPDQNLIFGPNGPRKLLIPVTGQFHFMTEPTIGMKQPCDHLPRAAHDDAADGAVMAEIADELAHVIF